MTREEAIKVLKNTLAYESDFAEAKRMAIEALSAEAEASDYTKWLEDIIVKAETLEWLCEDGSDREWCTKNCRYSSIQAECLRHIYREESEAEAEPTDTDLISRADAMNEFVPKEEYYGETVHDILSEIPSADAEPTVIRSRTLMPTKDFKEWAKRIRETNPNVIVIPCDAEVVSADAIEEEDDKWI